MPESIGNSALFTEALQRFHALWRQARAAEVWEPDAMSLATADGQGHASVRTVLLKEMSADGFVFYTNYESRKGRQLLANSRAALCFLWKSLRRQVIVEGEVFRLSPEDSDAYFAGRDRLSQLGAWASEQSQSLDSREALEARLRSVQERYAARPVPRPPSWGGYRLAPDLIEFWAPVEGRLNERERYRRSENGEWRYELVNP